MLVSLLLVEAAAQLSRRIRPTPLACPDGGFPDVDKVEDVDDPDDVGTAQF